MVLTKLFICIFALMLANAPLYIDSTEQSLRTLRHAGYVVQERDPCDGSGFCCELLPANKEVEAYYITLPDSRWSARHLQLLTRFTNLRQIRSERPIDNAEYELLKKLANDKTRVIVSVWDN